MFNLTINNNSSPSEIYRYLLQRILVDGDKLETRNHEVYSNIFLPRINFFEFPLIQQRPVAIKKAIEEMSWFVSGSEECPDSLLSWWEGQLSPDFCLFNGYPKQFRNFSYNNSYYKRVEFDQIAFLLKEIALHPSSRRLILTVWNPGEMAEITETNKNKNTPTCCHTIANQFFVRNNCLYMRAYQRSADMLLGVPHNWVQSWALLLYFAYHTGFRAGGMLWDFGDAHIYTEPSHIEVAQTIIDNSCFENEVMLVYKPLDEGLCYDGTKVPVFKAEDFTIIGKPAEPLTRVKPKLL